MSRGGKFRNFNKRAEGKIRNMIWKFVKTIKNQSFTLIGSIIMHHLDNNCKILLTSIQTKML